MFKQKISSINSLKVSTSPMIILLAILLISGFATAQETQLNHVHLYLAYNKIDSLLVNEQPALAREVYEGIKKDGYYIMSWKQHGYSNSLYFDHGYIAQGEQELLEAVEKGILNNQISYGSDSSFLATVADKYGPEVRGKVITKNNRLTDQVQSEYGLLIKQLIELNAADQKLYRDTTYRKYRRYWYDKTYGYPLQDSTINHDVAMTMYAEWRSMDSLKTEQYLEIVDSLGFIPDERITGGLTGNVLLIHASKYEKLSADLDSLALLSVKLGRITSHEYGWFRGYYDERHHKEHTYYYTIGRDDIERLPEDKQRTINRRRKSVGLRPWPAVVWDSNIY